MPRRRRPIRKLLSLLFSLLLIASGFAAGQASAQHLPTTYQVGPNLYQTGIPSGEFEYFAAADVGGRQRQANWCWAAAIQMVLNYHGLYVTQEQVVLHIFGSLADRPAASPEILRALSGWAPDTRGRFSSIHATPVVNHTAEIVQDLSLRWPLIVGLHQEPIGHAYVLTAVTYSVDPTTLWPIIHSVVLRDPWPYASSRVQLSWTEFSSRLIFVARVHVSRH